MSADNWKDGQDDWNTPGDWTDGVPTSSSNVVVAEGDPQVTTAVIVDSMTISAPGTVTFDDFGSSQVTGAVTISGALDIDATDGDELSGDDMLTTAALKNFVGTKYGDISLDGGSSTFATLDVTSAAGFGVADELIGQLNLFDDALVEFASGEITTITANGHLSLFGPNAFVADAATRGSNSALTGLKTVAGALNLYNGASISTNGALTNSGSIEIDLNTASAGGSTLEVGGMLTNSGSISMGNSSMADTITATAIKNMTYTSSIELSGTSPALAKLDVTSAAGFGVGGELIGTVGLTGDSLIEFASGEITTITDNGNLSLTGTSAFIADAGTLTSNSALTGLKSVAYSLDLEQGASISTNGALTNSGMIKLDDAGGAGGSALKVGGVLTNSDYIGIGDDGLSADDMITATALKNFSGTTYGSIYLKGGSSTLAKLDVASAAGFGDADELLGTVSLTDDALVEFAGGQITTIAANSQLLLNGTSAFVADATALTSNSALKGLATVTGSLYLYDGASISTNGALANSGDDNLDVSGAGGSTLRVGGELTNSGDVQIGNGGLSTADKITATGLVNTGTIDLYGNGAIHASLSVSGSVTNDDVVNIYGDTEDFTGAVAGTGSFFMYSDSTLEFASSVGSGETVGFNGADELKLGSANTFAATITGFGAGDSIDATTFGTGTTWNFVKNSDDTGGTLSLTDGGLTADLVFSGSYAKHDFSVTSTSAGTSIKFV